MGTSAEGETSGRRAQRCLLAQDDSVLQAFLEVGPDGGAGDVLDPDPQLLLLLRVILLCDLWKPEIRRSSMIPQCLPG